MKADRYPAMLAVLAAALYAVGTPASKMLLAQLPPSILAALLYLGAGIGMCAVRCMRGGKTFFRQELRFSSHEIPFVLGMIGLDILAPILMMLGLRSTLASSASLLNNFEIVATPLIALWLFHEPVRPKLWAAIALIVLASALLAFQDQASFKFSPGSALILSACTCWGLENNCTRKLSGRDPGLVVIVKGLGAGLGSLAVSWAAGERIGAGASYAPLALFLGFISYGLSIYFYVYAQRFLGAAQTSAFYAIAPFLGVLFSWIFLRETPGPMFIAALSVMLIGVFFVAKAQK